MPDCRRRVCQNSRDWLIPCKMELDKLRNCETTSFSVLHIIQYLYYSYRLGDEDGGGVGGGGKGPILQLSGVTVPIQSFQSRLNELQTLADTLPTSQEARKRYRMVARAKPVTWPRVRWSPVDDSRLLVGILKHGIGNWDSIRDDPDLNMGNKVSIHLMDCLSRIHLCWSRYYLRTSPGNRRRHIY